MHERLIFCAIIIALIGGLISKTEFANANPVNNLAVEDLYVANVPFVVKKPDFGGEACLAMFLRSKGFDVDQDYVFDASKLDPMLARGCHTKDLVVALRQMRINPGQVWHSFENEKDLQNLWQTISADLAKGQPTIVCRLEQDAEQFVLVIGYDATKDEIIFHDPNQANGKNRRLSRTRFLQSCSLSTQATEDRQHSSFISIRLGGDRLRVGKKSKQFTDADYAQHIRKLKQRLPHEGFNIVLQKPFVVVGDGTPESVKRTSIGTVKWAVDSIKKDYFSKDPYHIIDVWLRWFTRLCIRSWKAILRLARHGSTKVWRRCMSKAQLATVTSLD